MTCRLLKTILLLIACWPGGAYPKNPENTLASPACPQLFGDEQDHAENQEARKDSLRSLTRSRHCITVVHSQDWRSPRPANYMGIELVKTVVEEGTQPYAVLYLFEELEDIDCPTGHYAVRVDDSLGKDGRILAILSGLVLIEYQGELRYLKEDGIRKPVWRTVWVSPWKVLKTPGPGQTGARNSSRLRKSRHRPGKRRNRR